MRSSLLFCSAVLALSFLAAGCAGPERKLGRGINNVTEFGRGGEVRRSLEQSAIFGNPDMAYTTGFIRGFNRSLARTAVGVYEVVTFPFPPYDPVIYPVHPVYPDNYQPGVFDDPMFHQDAYLRFSGGEVAPMIPGSRFRVFDN
jgi:putative exosortase-associated protein (TIGR04073 family)